MNRQAINREQWLDILRSCSIHHRKMARDTAPVIIGEADSEEHILHKIWSLAIDEAVDLISILPTVDEESSETDLPQNREGPSG